MIAIQEWFHAVATRGDDIHRSVHEGEVEWWDPWDRLKDETNEGA